MLLFSLLFACSGEADDTAVATPTIAFLSPADGATVAVGDVAVSLVVDDFILVDVAKHGEGTPQGYISVTLDGAEVLQSSVAQFTVTVDAAGEHILGAELYYEDGDALEPPVSAEIVVIAE